MTLRDLLDKATKGPYSLETERRFVQQAPDVNIIRILDAEMRVICEFQPQDFDIGRSVGNLFAASWQLATELDELQQCYAAMTENRDALRERLARLDGAFKDIAKQRQTGEMSQQELIDADTDGAYNTMIDVARAALAPQSR